MVRSLYGSYYIMHPFLFLQFAVLHCTVLEDCTVLYLQPESQRGNIHLFVYQSVMLLILSIHDRNNFQGGPLKSEALRDMSSYLYVLYATLTNDVCGDCDCDWMRGYDCGARRSPITCCMALALLLVVVCNSGSWSYESDGALCLVFSTVRWFWFWLFYSVPIRSLGRRWYCTVLYTYGTVR